MDAVVINGVSDRGIGYSFSPPSGGFNFNNLPSFNEPFFDFPDSIPANAKEAYLGIVCYGGGVPGFDHNELEPGKLLKLVSTPNLHGQTVPGTNGAVIYACDYAYQFCKAEWEAIRSVFTSLPPWPTEIFTTKQGWQGWINTHVRDGIYLKSNELFTYLKDFSVGTGSGGMVLSQNGVDGFLKGTLCAFNPELPWCDSLPPGWFMPSNFIDKTWSWGDMMRIQMAGRNIYNTLSATYGTGEYWPAYDPDSFWDKIWRGVKRFNPAFMVMRGAFQALTELNVFGLAVRMNADQSKSKRIWVNGFGGKWSNLKSSINSGKNKSRILGAKCGCGVGCSNCGIGDPVTGGTVAAIIAAATPIVIAIVSAIGDDDTTDAVTNYLNSATAIVSEHCQEYLAAWATFSVQFGFQGLTPAQIGEQFKVSFPNVPDNCVDAFVFLMEEAEFFDGADERGGTQSGFGSETGNEKTNFLPVALLAAGAVAISNSK